MHPNRLAAGLIRPDLLGSLSAPPDPLAVLGEGRGRDGRWVGGKKGGGREGKGVSWGPPLWNPKYATARVTYETTKRSFVMRCLYLYGQPRRCRRALATQVIHRYHPSASVLWQVYQWQPHYNTVLSDVVNPTFPLSWVRVFRLAWCRLFVHTDWAVCVL